MKKRCWNTFIVQMENERGLDRAAAIAHMRFDFIQKICDETVIKPKESKEHLRSVAIDKILTGKYTAIPCFIGIMGLVFFLTFGVIGAFLSDLLDLGITSLGNLVDGLMTSWNVNQALHSLVIDGIFNGVGSVLSFLPIIVTLFFFLSLLEDSGYMARVPLSWTSCSEDRSVRTKHCSYAHRIRMHRSRRYGKQNSSVRERPQNDHPAHTVYELLGKTSHYAFLQQPSFLSTVHWS